MPHSETAAAGVPPPSITHAAGGAATAGLDPAQRAQIEAFTGLSLRDADPGALAFVVQRSREAGNAAFKQKRFTEAITMYDQAIAGAPADAALRANRSAARLAAGLLEPAAADARAAVGLAPGWPKAHFRLGAALLALGRPAEAAAALRAGAALPGPPAPELAARLADAEAAAAAEAAARAAAAAAARRDVTLKLRAARAEDRRLAALNSFKQSMAAPDWELEDLEWRPTFLPAMQLRPLDAEAFFAADGRRAPLAAHVAAVADLGAPKAALRALGDEARHAAAAAAVADALGRLPPRRAGEPPLALALGGGGGALAPVAARAGAAAGLRVAAVERGRSLFRMARQLLEANPCVVDGEDRVRLLDRPLRGVGVAGEPPPPELAEALLRGRAGAAAGGTAGGSASPSEPAAGAAALLPRRADALVTDLLDHGALGLGLLPALDHAAARLLAPGAAVAPRALALRAALVEAALPKDVAGFDLSAMDAYRWYPGAERVDLRRWVHRRLSAPVTVERLDLQARVAAAQARAAAAQARRAGAGGGAEEDGGGKAEEQDGADGDGSDAGAPAGEHRAWELDAELAVAATAGGTWNAVAFWFEADLGGGAALTSCPGEPLDGGVCGEAGVKRVFEAASFGQAVQYLDGLPVRAGEVVALRARRDAGLLFFSSAPPQCRPRHALVPRWHFDMLLDARRNAAYDRAIRRAVGRLAARRAATGAASSAPGAEQDGKITALDMGAGSSLLSMMAARAGADAVAAAEVLGHVADVAEECSIGNGFLGKITVLDRDVRRMDTLRKPDGTPPELPRRADLVVFEVFDSGLLGEGVLHLLAAARARLAAADAEWVPRGAAVYAQPLQCQRLGRVAAAALEGVAPAGGASTSAAGAAGLDASGANRWRWRPDYEGINLEECRDDWVPLADPVKVFDFDFTAADGGGGGLRPAEAAAPLAFTAAGVFNAVATWFELRLDEHDVLSTSPHAPGRGLTWQQAVQWVEEAAVRPGDGATLLARHDTYSVAYWLGSPAEVSEPGVIGGGLNPALAARRTGVPLRDAGWWAGHQALAGGHARLARACAQSPLEYRAAAVAAVAFAARPADVGLEAGAAAEFCAKMMG